MLKFLDGLDNDLRDSVLCQLRDLWTYTSTGLEGNSLSLGDTQFVIGQGLTVSGKPIKDHQEVLGHAKAIELVYSFIGRAITKDDLYHLHKAVQVELVSDIYKPYGAWKMEPNGTYAVGPDGKQAFIEYAAPADVEYLMEEWLGWLNTTFAKPLGVDHVVAVYAKAHLGFVHIHPFWDGNGRLARLLANLPVLNAGLPPIMIVRESRQHYFKLLSEYQLALGQINKTTGVWPNAGLFEPLVQFLDAEYVATHTLIENAFKLQRTRNVL